MLTIVVQKNGETIYFDEPFPKVHFMKLLSCSLYNSWHNLTRVGQLSKKDDIILSLPAGHYTLENITKELIKGLERYTAGIIKLKVQKNTPNSALKIINWETKPEKVNISHDLARLLGNNISFTEEINIKRLNTPSTYFIHCNLIDRHQNFLNNKKTDVLAKFDVRGNPYEKVTYEASPQQPFRDCSTDSYVSSITVSVRDEDGNLFDFNGMPLEFELELN